MQADGLKEVDRSAKVDFKILQGVRHAGGDRHLAGKVHDRRGAGDGAAERLRVANVRRLDAQAIPAARREPFCVLARARSGEVIERDDVATACSELAHEVGAEKTAAARHQHRPWIVLEIECRNAHATNPRLSSSAVAASTLSSAT